MITVAITFDAHALGRAKYEEVVQHGTVTRASGLLNLRWEDFSALDAAREIGLHGVAWEAVQDDTPGILTCIVRCADAALSELEKRLQEPPVFEYEIYGAVSPASITHGDR